MELYKIFPYIAYAANRAAKMYPNNIQKQRDMIDNAAGHCVSQLPPMSESTTDEWIAEIRKFATMNHPKSEGCSKVLQLMDDDIEYEAALEQVLAQYKQALEDELNHYV